MSLFRVLFLGTPEIAIPSLNALVEDEHFQVVGVITQPDRPKGRNMKVQPCAVKLRALELGLNCFSVDNVNSEENLSLIRELKPDCAVVIAFGQILSSAFLELFPIPSVNLHASLLPRWRGAAPIQRSIQAGDAETGMSLQVIVQKLDAGPLIGIRKIPLHQLRSDQLTDRLASLCPEILKQDFLDYLRGYLSPSAQDPTGVTIAKKIKKEDARVDWALPADQIYRNYLAFYGWPGCVVGFKGKLIKVLKMTVVESSILENQVTDQKQKSVSVETAMSKSSAALKVGQIIQLDSDGIQVQCTIGILRFEELQPESKSRMSASDFAKGYRLTIGDHFE